MRGSSIAKAFFLLFSALVESTQSLDYSDLEALGVSCPSRDKCDGYANNLSYIDRSCECGSDCRTYGTCCIDVDQSTSSGSQSTLPNGLVCISYGRIPTGGVYAIARCINNWRGSAQIRQNCQNSQVDFSDPLAAVPVTDEAHKKTYRNRYCAECNNADLASLTFFNLLVACDASDDLPDAQVYADITYNTTLKSWGIYRWNREDNATKFHYCEIAYDVPGYINNSVRFCRSELISHCPATWDRPAVREACAQYMAVVFRGEQAYRNPHCAICNGENVNDLTCSPSDIFSRKRPMSFALLMDVNQKDGDQVGMRRVVTPQCEDNWKYDPFFKKCRQLVCALPGYTMVNGRCISGG